VLVNELPAAAQRGQAVQKPRAGTVRPTSAGTELAHDGSGSIKIDDVVLMYTQKA
jgi:hypothetical protein